MNCQEGMELMQRHVDRDLNDAETARLMEHVGHCPECAAMFARLIDLSRGLERLPRVVPPYSIVDRILPELGEWDAAAAETDEPAETPLAPGSRRTERSRRAWAARASAMLAAGIIVGLFLVNGPIGKMGSSQKDAASGTAAESKQAANAPQAPMTALQPQDQYGPQVPFAAEAPQPSSDALKKSAPANQGGTDYKIVGKSDVSGPASGSAAAAASASPEASVVPPPANSPHADADNPIHNGSTPEASPGPVVTSEKAQGFAAEPGSSPSAAPMSIMGELAAEEEAVSPDGAWRAVLTDGKLQVYRQSDGSLVYDPAPDSGKRSGLAWSADSTQLSYTYTDAEGNVSEKYWRLPDMKEMTR